MTNSTARALLDGLIGRAKRIEYGQVGELNEVLAQTEMVLRRTFGEKNTYRSQLAQITFRPGIWPFTDSAHREAWLIGTNALITILETARRELELFPTEATPLVPQTVAAASRRVFVVHGKDEGLKQTVARTLERLDLDPIILHDQPNKGRTIIEKFENYADVPFAVVLLTPDDMAYVAGNKPETARPRARQNVVLELGFFLGRIGRENVVAIYSGDDTFELPSDYDGVLFIPYDDTGRWQFDLVRELRAAGIDVDATRSHSAQPSRRYGAALRSGSKPSPFGRGPSHPRQRRARCQGQP